LGGTTSSAINLTGGLSYGGILDDLAVTFFLKATQAHKDAKTLTAPRVTVISGERAAISLTKQIPYIENYTFTELTGESGAPIRSIAQPTLGTPALGGVLLSVLPTISADKKYVFLNIETSYQKVDLQDFPIYDTAGKAFPTQQPLAETSTVQTHVSVPDGGTLLIGGQKLGAEVNNEAGVPGLSKVPLLGRLFSSRSKIKDQEVLLVLVKPTIIIQEEAEREYFAPLE
jgi:type II secretory pathway component GspD/PulD (secretin)